MEMWTCDGQGKWKRWSHAGLGLEAVACAGPAVAQVLVVESDPDEDEQILAAIRLTRRLASPAVTVVAGSEHPSADWRESVRRAGADRALLVPLATKRGRRMSGPLEGAQELGDGICPELHALHDPRCALSVCGRHSDRMVLARHHFVRWCLAGKETCPHWQGGARG